VEGTLVSEAPRRLDTSRSLELPVSGSLMAKHVGFLYTFPTYIWDDAITMKISFLLLMIPIVAFILFWNYAVKRNWASVRLLSLTVSLCLLFITTILWITNTTEKWILGVGAAFSLFVGLLVLSFPITAPEVVSLLKFSGDAKEEMGSGTKNRQLLASLLFFFYSISFYLVVMYFLNPKTFIQDLPNRWWIIPFAFIIAITKYINSIRKK
jgi:hypothetical protein